MNKMLTAEQLARLVCAGDTDAVESAFAGMCEENRASLRSVVATLDKKVSELNDWKNYECDALGNPPDYAREEMRRRSDALDLAFWATASKVDIVKHRRWVRESQRFICLMQDRRPAWLQEIADQSSGVENPFSHELIRQMCVLGLIAEPQNDMHQLWLTLGGPVYNWFSTQSDALKNYMRDEPGYLSDRLWKVFEIEGTTELSVGLLDKRGQNKGGYARTLIELAEEGLIDRQRLLDASLEALARDFAQFRAGWFSTFHEALKPTATERVGRLDRYLSLLASSIPPTVTFAMNAIVLADKSAPQPASRLVPHLLPAVLAKAKVTAKAAIALLIKVGAREADGVASVIDALEVATQHPEMEIRELAKQWLKGHRTFDDRAEPSVSDARIESVKTPFSCLADENRIEPIRTTTELIDELSSLTESFLASRVSAPPDELEKSEQIFDAMVHFPILPDQRDLVAPLVRRVKKLSKLPVSSLDLQWLAFVDCWLNGEVPKPQRDGITQWDYYQQDPTVVWLSRMKLASELILSRVSRPLVASPTHRGGWIDPRVFVNRVEVWQKAGAEIPLTELSLGILRLAPEHRADALAAASSINGEAGKAIRYALGSDCESSGGTMPLWAAACRSRDPRGIFADLAKRYPDAGGDAFVPCHFAWEVVNEHGYGFVKVNATPPIRRDLMREAVIGCLGIHQFQGYSVERANFATSGAFAIEATLWPANREHFFSQCGFATEEAMTFFLRALLDPFVPMLPMATLTLALGLGAPTAELRVLATDAFITIVETCRLDAQLLGQTMCTLLHGQMLPLKRWAGTLNQAAQISTRHAEAVRDTLCAAFHQAPKTCPRDIASLLEVLVTVMTNDFQLPETTRAFLQTLPASGRTKTLCSRLLNRHA